MSYQPLTQELLNRTGVIQSLDSLSNVREERATQKSRLTALKTIEPLLEVFSLESPLSGVYGLYLYDLITSLMGLGYEVYAEDPQKINVPVVMEAARKVVTEFDAETR